MNMNYMQNGIRRETAANFQDVSSTKMSGIPGGTYKGNEYLNLINHREHMWTLDFAFRPPMGIVSSFLPCLPYRV